MGNMGVTFRWALFYGVILATAAFLLQWLEYQYFLKLYPTEIYIVILAILFVTIGIWVGVRLTQKKQNQTFIRNDAAIISLGLTPRECEVLDHLTTGQSNKEIARDLKVSPNTVKTHVAQIYQKLDVQQRVQAVQTARRLHLVP